MKIVWGWLLMVVFALPAHADNGENIFRVARAYTLQIKSAVKTPLSSDDAKGASNGAGFLVDRARGWVMTNAHVVSRSPARVEVAFVGQPFREARKVYVDPYLDLAVIAIDPPRDQAAAVAQLNCQDLPAAGHVVGAYGHPINLPFTGTRGIISGVTTRLGPEMLQLDAPINPGNSGGPLVSLSDGRVVGINSASLRGAQNANFALPSLYACRVLTLLQQGKDPSPPDLQTVFFRSADEKGLKVARTYLPSGYLALQRGDIIQAVPGVLPQVENETQLLNALRGRLDDVRLRVLRAGRELEIRGKLPAVAPVVDAVGLSFSGMVVTGQPAYGDAPEVKLFGLRIEHVEPGSLADLNEIGLGDIIEAVDDREFRHLPELEHYLRQRALTGQSVTLSVRRPGPKGYLFAYEEKRFEVDALAWIGKRPAKAATAAATVH